jgi:hypothetical protein
MKKSLGKSEPKMAGTKRPASASGEAKVPAKKRVKKEVEEEKKASEVIPAVDCASAVTAADGGKGMNAAIAEQIERLYKYYQSIGDKGRTFGYRNALRAIKSIDEPILSAEQLEGR